MSAPVLTTLPSGRTVLDTGKVHIGLMAAPRAPQVGCHAELIQAALLASPPPRRSPQRPLRAEREALAHAAGITFELDGLNDDEVDELTALAEAGKEGRLPFNLRTGGAAIGIVAAIAFAVALWGGPLP